MKYLYDSHLGGIFFSDTELTFEECYCEQCGDSDYLIGTFETLKDLWSLIKDECSINGSGGYSLQYIFPILVSEFKLDVEVTYDSFDYQAQGFCNLTDDLIVSLIETYM